MSSAIELKNVSVKYDSQEEPTLKNISFNIQQGEKVLVAGSSGSGKSTLSRLINGLIPNAFSGEITGQLLINGEDAKGTNLFERSLQIGTVLQDSDTQFVGLTTAEDIAFALENDQMNHSEMLQQVSKWAEILDLEQLLKLSPQSLSGGQKQRVAMAGVLIDNSPILIFDEPLASLDPASGYRMMKLLDELQANQNLTVIIIEHRLEETLQSNVDHVILLDEGEVKFDGTPEELLIKNKLNAFGLATPAYVRLLDQAGVDLKNVDNLTRPAQISEVGIANKLREFQTGLTEPVDTKITEPILEIKQLNFAYGDKQLFENLNLTINRGELVALVGKNGSGKSTLSEIIVGFLQEKSGQLNFDQNIDLTTLSIKERAEHIGYVSQNPNSMLTQTIIFDEVALGLKLRNYPEEEIEAQVNELLKVAGLYEMRHWPITALSYGQKKRLSIISVLSLKPDILILDEPTAGQDLKHAQEIMRFVKKLNEDLGTTIIVITHDMSLMLSMTERALVMVDGKLIADLAPAKLLTSPRIIEKADLRLTSVYTLAQALNLEHVESLVRAIAKETV